jgi:YHS domain-containing protein
VGPLRILILAALLYIGYRLISANFKKTDDKKKKDTDSTQSGGAITDVLVEDPVCHKLVPKQQAHLLELDDQKIYFCSKGCCDTFVAEREKTE